MKSWDGRSRVRRLSSGLDRSSSPSTRSNPRAWRFFRTDHGPCSLFSAASTIEQKLGLRFARAGARIQGVNRALAVRAETVLHDMLDVIGGNFVVPGERIDALRSPAT